MSAALFIVVVILWWQSAELIILHGWTRTVDLNRFDLWVVRVVAVFGPVVATCIWLAFLWADQPIDDDNPLVKSRRQP